MLEPEALRVQPVISGATAVIASDYSGEGGTRLELFVAGAIENADRFAAWA